MLAKINSYLTNLANVAELLFCVIEKNSVMLSIKQYIK